MREARLYQSQSACPVARTLDVIGDRWTILVLRDLLRGRHRYGELQDSLRGIPAAILGDRLKRLEERGMVERRFYCDHPPRAEYHLTAKGQAFVPVLVALKRYGEQWEPLTTTEDN